MSKTYRADPSNPLHLKKQKHAPRRRLEEDAFDSLIEYPHKHNNRIKSANSAIANPWDDKVVASSGEIKHKKSNYGYKKDSVRYHDYD